MLVADEYVVRRPTSHPAGVMKRLEMAANGFRERGLESVINRQDTGSAMNAGNCGRSPSAVACLRSWDCRPAPVIPRASDRLQHAGHQNVVDVPPAEEEFLTQDPLDREAARLIEPAGRDIATKDTQRQLACAPAAGLLDTGFHELAPHPAALAGRVDRQPPDLQHMGARRQGAWLAERHEPGYHTAGLSDQYIGGRYPFAEEGRIGGWRRSWRNASRPRGRIDVPEPRFVFGPGRPNSRHHTRMNPAEHSRRQLNAKSQGPADLPASPAPPK